MHLNKLDIIWSLNALLFGAISVMVVQDQIEDGYRNLNLPNGWNFACEIDPSCRKLSDAEINLARQYLGDEIDYKHINIFKVEASTDIKNRNVLASALPNTIRDYSQSLNDPHILSEIHIYVLMHELTHIWQFKHLGSEEMKRLEERDFGKRRVKNSDYNFDPFEKDDFLEFNIEQQAGLVAKLPKIESMILAFKDAQDHYSMQGYCDLLARQRALVSAYITPVNDVKYDQLCRSYDMS